MGRGWALGSALEGNFKLNALSINHYITIKINHYITFLKF